MFGLMIFGMLGLYLLISIGVVLWAISHARKHGKSAKRWAWGAAFVMYSLVFWDWLPTVAMHKYYCATESGFWVYKTLDQWKAENPGVMEGLSVQRVPPHQFEGSENHITSTTCWNSRIKSIHRFDGPIFLHSWRRDDVLIDTKTNEVLARYVDYSTSHERRQAGWSGWKFWLQNEGCVGGRDKAIQFVKFVEQFKGAEK